MYNYLWLLVLVALVASIGSFYWYYRRSVEMLRSWARQNDYHIISRERRVIRTGPFFLTTGRWQAVFRIIIQDPEGYTRNGWVRVGSFWGGLFSDKVETRWDEGISQDA